MILETRSLEITIAGRRLCRELDLSLNPGEVWGVLGPNGAGKSTLLHTLAGLRAPDGGSVQLEGRALSSLSGRERAQSIGVLLQDHDASLPVRVIDTVLSGRHPHLSRFAWEGPEDYRLAAESLEIVDMTGAGTRRLSTLSGGERRRVEIAALIAQQTPIRLLDEPTSHLDLPHQLKLLDWFRSGTDRRHLTFMILHDPNLVLRYCTHVLLLPGNGDHRLGPVPEILTSGALTELFGHPISRLQDGEKTCFMPA